MEIPAADGSQWGIALGSRELPCPGIILSWAQPRPDVQYKHSTPPPSWGHFEGPSQLQSSSWDQLRAMLQLHGVSAFLSSQTCLPHSLTGVTLRALPGKPLNTDLPMRNQWQIMGVAGILVLLQGKGRRNLGGWEMERKPRAGRVRHWLGQSWAVQSWVSGIFQPSSCPGFHD